TRRRLCVLTRDRDRRVKTHLVDVEVFPHGRPFSVGGWALISYSLKAWSAYEINRREQADPNHVDEMPVVRHHDGGRRLSRRELAQGGSYEEIDERQQAADHVEPVE